MYIHYYNYMYMIVHVYTEVEITVKHQTIPDHLACLSK